MQLRATRGAIIAAICMAVVAAAAAQGRVPELQDILGFKDRDGEGEMVQRGYVYSGDEREFKYWRRTADGRCVRALVRDGRYRSVEHAAQPECDRVEARVASGGARPAPPVNPSPGGFVTLCGWRADRETHRYRCRVDGVEPGASGKTVVAFPQARATLTWRRGSRVRVAFVGAPPVETGYSERRHVVRFRIEEREYFYVSDRDVAARELRSVR